MVREFLYRKTDVIFHTAEITRIHRMVRIKNISGLLSPFSDQKKCKEINPTDINIDRALIA